jgi:hypothetical protein
MFQRAEAGTVNYIMPLIGIVERECTTQRVLRVICNSSGLVDASMPLYEEN